MLQLKLVRPLDAFCFALILQASWPDARCDDAFCFAVDSNESYQIHLPTRQIACSRGTFRIDAWSGKGGLNNPCGGWGQHGRWGPEERDGSSQACKSVQMRDEGRRERQERRGQGGRGDFGGKVSCSNVADIDLREEVAVAKRLLMDGP